LSARRFTCDLEEACRRGHVGRAPHFNSVLNALENESLTPILMGLIRQSALPLTGVEKQFAIDSSGFCTSRFTRWFDVKYGVTRDMADWVKVHIVCGTKTHIVTAVTVLEKHTADVKQLPDLTAETSRNFTIHEMSADAAYASQENFEAVTAAGGAFYPAFRSNATGSIGGLFEKAFHYFCILREEYLKHYHRRSNVESVFSMVKRKFGDSVRSKTDVAMKNEALAKILCHNICINISALYELGIEPLFLSDKPGEESQDVLPFRRPAN
jgi:transposase